VAPVRFHVRTLLCTKVKEGANVAERLKYWTLKITKRSPTSSRGYLRGFAFASDSQSFYLRATSLNARRPDYRAAFHHVLAHNFPTTARYFSAGGKQKPQANDVPGYEEPRFLTVWFLDKAYTASGCGHMTRHPPQSITGQLSVIVHSGVTPRPHTGETRS